MNEKIKLTIIIPCYNVGKYVDRCMESLIHQTVGLQNMQFVLVDDASSDDTKEKLREWQLSYRGVVDIIRNDHNRRQGTCRNLGLAKAKGEYVGFVDADDWVEPDMYEKMLNIAEVGECDIVQCASTRDEEYKYWSSDKEKKTGKLDRVVKIPNNSDRSKLIASNLLGTYVVTKIYKRDFLMKNQFSFPEGMIYEDVYWMGLLNCYSSRIGFLEEKMYHYYVNSESVSQVRNVIQHKDIIRVNRLLWGEYKKRGFLDCELKEALEYDLLCTYYLTAIKMIFLRFDNIPYEMFYEVQRDIRKMAPDYAKNKYIDEYTKPFNCMLLACINKDLTHEQIDEIGKIINQMLEVYVSVA